ncbi:pyruvate dehydrogenase (acetyl-transferring) E1 component subunit alpha [Candidatus Micrarchaeota archaeon]|nr:pyruvate dehydrogenase (acetyl-transferring) E1 component subunit alpha [Candidatus Micrarchaeota archaeon]
MPVTKVFEGKVDYIQILDKDGKIDSALDPKLPSELLEKMYRYMVLARAWDKKNLVLQRTGRMYTYAPVEGQEAIVIGSGLAAAPTDWVFPTYRETFLYHMRGASLGELNVGWMGWEDGLKIDQKMCCFPLAIPIATQFAHAVGGAYALKLRGINSAALVYGGDGSTSEGDFHDALNFAGVWNSGVVFVVSNNQFAISVPRKWQTKSETIAQKALAYGFKGVQVDGNDILAVYSVIKEAANKAREGHGPTLIEAITFRMGPHTTADDPKKYRSEEEVAYWRERDPITRFQIYLKGKGIWTQEYEQKLQTECSALVEEGVAKAEGFKADPKNIFKFVFKDMTKDLEEQMNECFSQ